MATITVTYPTLVDICNAHDPNGGIAKVAEVLSKKNPVIQDIPWVEGNLATGHRIVLRNALPTPTWRRFNLGVSPTFSPTTPVDEACGILEAQSNVDVELAQLNGNTAAWRAQQDSAYIEAMSQEVASAVFYHSTKTDPEKIYGLSPRYDSSSSGTTSSYCLKVGTTSTTGVHSIWLINWEPGKVYGIYPKGSTAGLSQEDWGRQLIVDSSGNQLPCYVTRYVWRCGLAVEDYRYAVRVVWDTDDSTNGVETAKAVYSGMTNALSTIYEVGPNARFYMDRTSYSLINRQLGNNSADYLRFVEAGGRLIPSFLGVPIRVTDALVAETVSSTGFAY